MDIIPSIKDPANIKWLQENEETFIEYMAGTHSSIDLAHTYLHYTTFDDKYVATLIKRIEIRDQRLKAEKEKRDAAPKPSTPKKKKTGPEKKIEAMEKAAIKIEKDKLGDDDLFDDED
jgi:hypothetical protein